MAWGRHALCWQDHSQAQHATQHCLGNRSPKDSAKAALSSAWTLFLDDASTMRKICPRHCQPVAACVLKPVLNCVIAQHSNAWPEVQMLRHLDGGGGNV